MEQIEEDEGIPERGSKTWWENVECVYMDMHYKREKEKMSKSKKTKKRKETILLEWEDERTNKKKTEKKAE